MLARNSEVSGGGTWDWLEKKKDVNEKEREERRREPFDQ